MRVKEMRCHTPDALPLELLRLVDLKLHNQLIDALKLMIWEWHFGFPLQISSQWWCAESLRARPLDSEPQWTSKAKQKVFFFTSYLQCQVQQVEEGEEGVQDKGG